MSPHFSNHQAFASFDSWVEKVGKALTYLNRFYVNRLGLPTLEQVALPEQEALRAAFSVARSAQSLDSMHL